mgnify:CR=1 FL=1
MLFRSAAGTTTRLPQLPDVATVAEQGYKGFEMTQWYGLLAPSKMAKANLDKLESHAVAAGLSLRRRSPCPTQSALLASTKRSAMAGARSSDMAKEGSSKIWTGSAARTKCYLRRPCARSNAM